MPLMAIRISRGFIAVALTLSPLQAAQHAHAAPRTERPQGRQELRTSFERIGVEWVDSRNALIELTEKGDA